MKKMIVITMVVVVALLVASVPALAQSEMAAIVLKGDDHPYGCFTGQLPGVFLTTEDAVHTVGNSSGLVKLVCHFVIPEGDAPAKVYKSEGFGCGIYFPTGSVVTTNSRFVATPGGTATMECMYKP